jgi:uncharacterized protein YjiS (DUF1127 family)
MITVKMISEKFNAWRRHRETVRELSQYSDHELCDIGIRRCDIEDIVRRGVRARRTCRSDGRLRAPKIRRAASQIGDANLLEPRHASVIRTPSAIALPRIACWSGA